MGGVGVGHCHLFLDGVEGSGPAWAGPAWRPVRPPGPPPRATRPNPPRLRSAVGRGPGPRPGRRSDRARPGAARAASRAGRVGDLAPFPHPAHSNRTGGLPASGARARPACSPNSRAVVHGGWHTSARHRVRDVPAHSWRVHTLSPQPPPAVGPTPGRPGRRHAFSAAVTPGSNEEPDIWPSGMSLGDLLIRRNRKISLAGRMIRSLLLRRRRAREALRRNHIG
jgi:hypothetical protein